MNPFHNSEMAEDQLKKLLKEKDVTEAKFHHAMEVLSEIAADFGEGGDYRFAEALRAANMLRSQLWYIMRDIDNLKP